MAGVKKKYNCPECKKEHTVVFDFYDPEDGDEDEQTILCDCGCEFDVSCEIHVDFDYSATHPIVRKTGIGVDKIEYDINDTSTWPPQKPNPDQLTII